MKNKEKDNEPEWNISYVHGGRERKLKRKLSGQE